ncbi:hypothetical protein [Myroides sp. LoEW2-1]|uniref:hypothetical protein n=1 Tax=Myroides sp. LoEW2-1 TaxID=2683192 RepID=UPI00132BF092|nr:hypothetical protein [Myroides sp. LoEW2-1]MVX35325.1 hypothetical protein [Myroides sp. LoEW2-1]
MDRKYFFVIGVLFFMFEIYGQSTNEKPVLYKSEKGSSLVLEEVNKEFYYESFDEILYLDIILLSGYVTTMGRYETINEQLIQLITSFPESIHDTINKSFNVSYKIKSDKESTTINLKVEEMYMKKMLYGNLVEGNKSLYLDYPYIVTICPVSGGIDTAKPYLRGEDDCILLEKGSNKTTFEAHESNKFVFRVYPNYLDPYMRGTPYFRTYLESKEFEFKKDMDMDVMIDLSEMYFTIADFKNEYAYIESPSTILFRGERFERVDNAKLIKHKDDALNYYQDIEPSNNNFERKKR